MNIDFRISGEGFAFMRKESDVEGSTFFGSFTVRI